MPRIRSLKPEIWNSPDFMALDGCGQLAFIALITMSDDHGRTRTDASHLHMVALRAFPVRVIEAQLARMTDLGMIDRYSVDGRSYVQMTNWSKHQRVDRPSASSIPSADHPGAIREPSRALASPREPSIPRARPRTGSDQTGEDLYPPVEVNLDIPPGGERLTDFEGWIAALNRACGRRFNSRNPDAERRYRVLRGNGWSVADLLAVARGAGLSPHHRGDNDQHRPYQDPVTILRSKQLETLRDLGYGDIQPPATSADAWEGQVQRYEVLGL